MDSPYENLRSSQLAVLAPSAGGREKPMEVGREDYDTEPVEIARLLRQDCSLAFP